DSHRRDCIRRRDNCSKNKARCQREFRNKVMRQKTDCDGGKQNQTDSQQQNRAKIGAKIPPRSEESSRIKQWWQKTKEHQLRVQAYSWQTGNNRQRQTA